MKKKRQKEIRGRKYWLLEEYSFEKKTTKIATKKEEKKIFFVKKTREEEKRDEEKRIQIKLKIRRDLLERKRKKKIQNEWLSKKK